MLRRREERDAGARLGGRGRRRGVLPPTVQAVIAARIDQLSPAARELVRRASVFPRGRFDLDELSLIVEPRKDLLDEAEDEELLDPRRGAAGRVALRQRRPARRRVRLAREARAPAAAPAGGEQADRAAEDADRYPRTIAFHLEQAALAALDLDPARPHPGRAGGRGARRRGRPGAPPARVALGRRSATSARWRCPVRPEDWGEREAGSSRCWARPATGWGSSIRPRRPSAARWRSRATAATACARTRRGSWPTSRSRSAATSRGRRSCSMRRWRRRAVWPTPPRTRERF